MWSRPFGSRVVQSMWEGITDNTDSGSVLHTKLILGRRWRKGVELIDLHSFLLLFIILIFSLQAFA